MKFCFVFEANAKILYLYRLNKTVKKMTKNLYTIYFAILMCVIAVSCSSSKKTQADASSDEIAEIQQTIVPDTFVLPVVPEAITDSDERAKFVVLHYWDRFDFANQKLIQRPEITEQAFVDYINLFAYVPFETIQESLIKTLKQAEKDSAMYSHFASLFDKYFYDPNSPFRNEEYYIPVLRSLVKSSILKPEEKSRYEFQLDLVMKNRVGDVANDFTYTLASGVTATLHSLNSEFVLLMFSNPGCSTCAAVMERLTQSQELNEALSLNSSTRTMLTILTIYPDNNLDEWREHLPQMPPKWTHGYDDGMVITQKRLYDIKAIPTLYLLDKDKKVILKDTLIEAIESFFSVSN